MCDGKEILTVQEAAELIDVSVRTIRRYIADGLLTPDAVKGRGGENYRLRRADVLGVKGKRREVIEQARTSPVERLFQGVSELRSTVEELRNEQRVIKEQLDRIEKAVLGNEAERDNTEPAV